MLDIKKNTGDFIKEKFASGKYKQLELANYLGIGKAAVNHWVLGTALPDPIYVDPIAKFFNVSVLEVIGIKDISLLNDKEKLILEQYKQALPEIQEAVDRLLKIK